MKSKISLLIGYIKISWSIVVICSNWLSIIIAKILNKPLESIQTRRGDRLSVGGIIGKADLCMFAEIWYYKFYNTKGYEITKDDIVFDIGANSGYFTIYAAKMAKQVYAFEPMQNLYNKIVSDVESNNFKNVIVEDTGIAKDKGVRVFYESTHHNGCHSLYNRAETDKKIEIKTVNIEDYCKENSIDKIDFLKIDCEGAEYEIFDNLSTEFIRKVVKKIVMEHHDDIIPGRTHEDIVKILKANNYQVEVANGFVYGTNMDMVGGGKL